MDYEFNVCALSLSRVFMYKCRIGRQLIDLCGGVTEVFDLGEKALLEMLPEGGKYIRELFDPKMRLWAEDEVSWAQQYGVKLLCCGFSGYPKRLAECDDAPIVLYCKGDADLDAERMLAVVGTRRATFYGKGVCEAVVAALGANPKPPTIVSGLAFGIDAHAHRSAMEAKIPTIAVLPTGLDCIYPAAHRDLAKLILQSGGALVTDFSRNTAPALNQFRRRNRIIAGMSDATLLVESFAKGGGLITTSLANSYDREVFAIPGRTVDPSFDGCNNLIEKNLAHLATGAASIENLMGWTAPEPKKMKLPELEFGVDSLQGAVVKVLLERSPIRFNALLELLRSSGNPTLDQQALSAVLLELEMSDRIGVSGGDVYELRR